MCVLTHTEWSGTAWDYTGLTGMIWDILGYPRTNSTESPRQSREILKILKTANIPGTSWDFCTFPTARPGNILGCPWEVLGHPRTLQDVPGRPCILAIPWILLRKNSWNCPAFINFQMVHNE